MDVKDENAEEVRLCTYFAREKADKTYSTKQYRRFKFKVGDYVRLSHLRTVFIRAYDETDTGEVFQVSKQYRRGTIPVYRFQGMQAEDIKGTFYQSELQNVDINPDQLLKNWEHYEKQRKGTK